MKCVIYGRDNCSFCKRAVELAKQLQGHGYGEILSLPGSISKS